MKCMVLMKILLVFAVLMTEVLSIPYALPHHHYKEKTSVHTKYKGYYPSQAVIVEQPAIIYGGGYGHSKGGYGGLEGGYGHHGGLGGGYGHGGSVSSASAVAVASVGGLGGSAASASASSAGGYGYGRK